MKKILACGVAAFALVPAIATARPITPDDLVGLRRVSAPAVSPDGRLVAYQLRETDLAANKGRNDIWLIDRVRRIAPRKIAGIADKNETAPQFSADGGHVYYLSDQSGSSQVWRIVLGADTAEQVTDTTGDLSGFLLSSANNRLAVWADRPAGARDLSTKLPDKTDGSARTYDGLFVRHWDAWADGTRSQIFVLTLRNGKATGNGVSVMGKLVGDAPSKPMGDVEEIAWARDGKTLYFALREAGRIEASSTNLDIFAAAADGSRRPVNLTEANDAMDTLPAVSPDGKWLAYAAMKRPTYEADRQVVMLRNLKSGKTRALTEGWDRSVESIAWAPNSASLLVTARDNFDRPVFSIDLADGKPRRLTGEGSAAGVVATGAGAVYALDSLTAPADLFALDEYGKSSRLTSVNADKLDGIEMPVANKFSFAGAGGDTVWGYAVTPTHEIDGRKLPVAYLIHGGPQSTFGNGWSYRWNPAIFAGAGYAAVLIDFHGSVGHGQTFTDSINKDWGGKPFEDLKLGLDAVAAKFPALDTNNACALGGSYGGYMVAWIAGQWPDRFKCLVNHAGIFDARSMAYTTEELWFDEWEHGGPYHEQAEEYERWNPINHVAKWKTPQLVIHGEKDFRVPYAQGLGAFTALQRRDIPSKLVVFPDENHWILKPKNSLQWHGAVFDWMKRWTK